MEDICVQVHYGKPATVCSAGQTVNYVAGSSRIMLVGEIVPTDKSWDHKYIQLIGHLIEDGGCTYFHVDKFVICR